MSDRLLMLEATLDLMDEGVAILDEKSNVVFWNKAAAALTGYPAADLISRRCPDDLYRIDAEHQSMRAPQWNAAGSSGRTASALSAGPTELDVEPNNDDLGESPTLVSLGHKLGHLVPGMLRKVALRDLCSIPTGAVLLFYPVEEVDALPHGESGEGVSIERSQADMEDRLEAAYHQWATNRMQFGLLWVTIDQAQDLRKTHGQDACEAMLRTMEQTLLRQMKPAAVIGRWGKNEFLVLAHERTAEILLDHARRLAGVARTADFRWWGDRVGLTVSIGASQTIDGDTLQSALHRAQQAMQASQYAGGNQVMESRGM